MIEWLLNLLFKRKDIGRQGTPLMRRWTLWKSAAGIWSLHHILRDDDPYYHDHPWPFWTLILWGGYYEHCVEPEGGIPFHVRRWRRPLARLTRPAPWRHFLTLRKDRHGRPRSAWTLIWTGRPERTWYFHVNGRTIEHTRYDDVRLTEKESPR